MIFTFPFLLFSKETNYLLIQVMNAYIFHDLYKENIARTFKLDKFEFSFAYLSLAETCFISNSRKKVLFAEFFSRSTQNDYHDDAIFPVFYLTSDTQRKTLEIYQVLNENSQIVGNMIFFGFQTQLPSFCTSDEHKSIIIKCFRVTMSNLSFGSYLATKRRTIAFDFSLFCLYTVKPFWRKLTFRILCPIAQKFTLEMLDKGLQSLHKPQKIFTTLKNENLNSQSQIQNLCYESERCVDEYSWMQCILKFWRRGLLFVVHFMRTTSHTLEL